MSRYEAVIFDMDGVLADSEPIYHAAMQTVLEPLGHVVTEQHQRDLMGRSLEDTWAYFQNEFGLEGSLDDIIQGYDMELQAGLSKVNQALPGVVALVNGLKERGVRIAVASSSLPSWMHALLRGLQLENAFDAYVSGSEVERPKPAPDIYLEAASQLGVAPDRCIAIEDTPTGLAAAKAAGMLAIQVRAASTAWEALPNADIVLPTLVQFDYAILD